MILNIMPLVLYEHYSSLFSPFAFKNMLGAKNLLINSKSGAGIQFILNQGRKGLEILSCKEYLCLLTGCMGESTLGSILVHLSGTALNFGSDPHAAPASRTELVHGNGNNSCQVEDSG